MSTVALKRVARVIAGQSPPSSDVSDYEGVGLPFLQGNAEFGSLHPVPIHRCDLAPKRCSTRDVLLSVRAPVGALNIADQTYGIGRGLCAIRPHPGTNRQFLWWALNALRAELDRASVGSTYAAVTAEDVDALPIPRISESTQRAIADFLDAETARIDALIAKKRRMLSLLDERDRRMVDECFAPRSGESCVRLARLADVQTGVTLHEGRTLSGDVVTRPYLRVANVQPGWLDLSEVKTVTLPKAMASRSTLRAGDVLMTEGGDRDKLGRGTVWRGEIPDCLHQNHVFAVRPGPLYLSPDYLGYLTRTSHARAYFESTGVQSTNLASTSASKVADFPTPALSLSEQRARVDRYQQFAARNSRISAALKEQLELLIEHRQALITAAVTGQIEVPGVASHEHRPRAEKVGSGQVPAT